MRKGQIQALEGTQPCLPMTRGRGGTMTHDCQRSGTTTLFAALDVLTGTVIGRCLPRHRNTEFLKFLRTIDPEVPKGLQVHMILDNYATHKHPNVKKWLDGHPRFHLHFTPRRQRTHRHHRELAESQQRQPETIHLDRHRRTNPGFGLRDQARRSAIP
jgi:DDE superfamily endonuclease